MENERNVSPVSAHAFNNEKPPCESRVASLSKKQYSIFMLRAAARIQSNLLCKFINSGSMVQTTLSCRYAAIHLVYLGIYTREEKMCPQDAVFLRDSLESVVSSERLFGKRSFSTVSKGRTKRFVLCFYSSSEIALRIAASCCSTASSRLLSSSGCIRSAQR